MTRIAPSLILVLVAAALCGCRQSPPDLVRAGDEFLREGNYAEAALNYRKAFQQDPTLGPACLGAGRAEQARERFREAYGFFSRAVELMPESVEAKAALADLCLFVFARENQRVQSLYQRAVEVVDDLASLDPDGFDTLRLRGSIALLDRKPDQAVEFLDRANQKKPGDLRVIAQLAQGWLTSGQPARAEKIALEAIENNGSFGEMYDFIYAYYVSAGRTADAEAILSRKVENNPTNADYVIQLAGFHAAAGDDAKAAPILQRLFDDPARFPDARLRVGDMYFRLRNPLRAAEHYEAGLKGDPERKGEYHKRLAGIYWAQGKRDEAVSHARASVEALPEDQEARRLRGSMLLEQGRPEDLETVIGDYSLLVGKSPDNQVLHYQLGRAYRAKGDQDKAWSELQAATRDTRTYLAPRLSLAEVSAERGMYDETLRYLDEILRVDTRNPNVRWLRAATLRNLGRNDDARQELLTLIREHPNEANYHLELGLLNLAAGRHKDAEAIFAKWYRPGAEDVRPVVGLAQAAAAQGDHDRAIALLEKEAQLRPEDVGPRRLMAEIAAGANRIPLALKLYEEILARSPDDPKSRVALGQLLIGQGETDRGLSHLAAAAQAAADNATVQLSYATALDLAGRADRARSVYRAALERDRNNPATLNNYAYFCARTDSDLDEALRMAQRAAQQAPENASFADTLGFVYLKRGMTDSALQVFRSLVVREPGNPTFRLHLAMALVKKGRAAEAVRELKEALARRPSAQEQQEIERLLASLG